MEKEKETRREENNNVNVMAAYSFENIYLQIASVKVKAGDEENFETLLYYKNTLIRLDYANKLKLNAVKTFTTVKESGGPVKVNEVFLKIFDDEQENALCIPVLFRSEAEDHFKNQRIDTFQMAVLIFGATDSPFANYALTYVGRPRREFSSATIETILKWFYEDNLLKCVVTKQEAIDVAKELKIEGFQLTKFWSNDEDVLKCVTDSERKKSVQKKSIQKMQVKEYFMSIRISKKMHLHFHRSDLNQINAQKGIS